MVVLVAALLVSAFVMWKLQQRAVQDERVRIAALTSDHAHAIQTSMERALSATYALAAMVRQGRGHVPEFEGVATEMLSLYPGITSLGLSPGGVVQHVAPRAGNEKTIGFDAFNDPNQGREARLARDTGKLTLAGPLKLVQGGMGAVGRLPIFLPQANGDSVFWGLTYVVLRFPQALEDGRLAQLANIGLDYTLWRTDSATGVRQVIDSSQTTALQDPVERQLELPNGQWTLGVAPIKGWGNASSLILQMALGLACSLTLAYTAHLMVRQITRGQRQEALIAERTREIAASKSRLQATLDAIPDLILEIGLDGICYDYHVSSSNMTVPPAKHFLGHTLSEVLAPKSARSFMAALLEAALHGSSHGCEFVLDRPGGGLIWYELSVNRKPGDADEEPRFITLSRDITQRKQAESDLRIAATAFNSQEGVAITDADDRVLRINHAFTEITGYSADEAIGRKLDFLNSGEHAEAFYEATWASVQQNGAWRGEIWNRRKNGDIFPCYCAMTAVKGDDGLITHCVNSLSDITQRKATEEEIKKLAFYDPLTNLPNRRLLIDRLRQALAQSGRSGRMGALQFIDLDNFKTLNDTLGHDMGDRLLQQVALRLTQCMRQGDTVARLGGDEFVVLLEELSPIPQEAAAQAKLVGEKTLAAINQPYRLAGLDYHISPSIGVTLYSDHHVSTDDLLKQADLAMYQSKAAGRNTLRFFDPTMQAIVTARASMEADIRQGILQSQFLLHYQPQVDRQGNTVGAEVLLRWPHPQRGMVSPAEFIPLTEDTGLIVPLGNWVIETACAQLVAWADQPKLAHLALSVNVSARQFRQQDFVSYVLGLLDYTGANAHRLKLELTESLLVNDVEETIAKMTVLKDRGVGFTLDDFGTGYSSLSYLKRLPLDELKIDQSFVSDMMTDPNDASIARTVIVLGHNLGLKVVAEGVETIEQQQFLAAQQCDFYQGYLLGRPMPLSDFEQRMLAL